MVCEECGTAVAAGVNYCTRCGVWVRSVGAPPVYAAPPVAIYGNPYLPRPRVQRHLQTLGILWLVFAAYRALAVLIAICFFKAVTYKSLGGGWPFAHDWADGWSQRGLQSQGWIAALLPVVAAVTIIATLLALFVGFSLLKRKPWGRTLAIVAAVLVLLRPLMGTALGIYTLWVLSPRESGAEYEAIAER